MADSMPADPLDALYGTWRPIQRIGREDPLEEFAGRLWKIRPGMLSVEHGEEVGTYRIRMQCDCSAKPFRMSCSDTIPAGLNDFLDKVLGSDHGFNFPEPKELFRAIFAVEGDRLIVAVSQHDRLTWPENFEHTEAAPKDVTILERVAYQGKIERILDEVQLHDDNPPDAEYSIAAWAVEAVQGMSEAQFQELMIAALRRLPNGLALSFLFPIIEARLFHPDPAHLYGEFVHGNQIDTAAGIVELLTVACGEKPDEIADWLIQQLQHERREEAQARLAYALWVLFCSETLLIQDGKTVGYLVSQRNADFDQLIGNKHLSEYARDTLQDCRNRT